MGSIVKPVITCLLTIMAVTIILTRTDTVTNQWANDELDYALRVATQDATAVMMSDNYIFGEDEESGDFGIDLQKATNQFKSSFYANIGSTMTEVSVNDMVISLSGYIGYRNIYAIYGSGQPAAAFSYTHAANNKIYEFTLGDKVYVTDRSTAAETITYLSDYSEHFFDANLTNENFRQITVMRAINEYLTLFYSDSQNITAKNAGSGVEFDLGLIDYAENDPSVMTKLSSVIDGPGIFAVVDCMDVATRQPVRILSLGAAEFVLKDS